MKTRTNQTISLLVVASMVALTTAQINTLSAGDIVLKKDASGYHSYIVSYKKEGTGICLTYTDASCVETVSYDLVNGEWVYNSTDLTQFNEKQDKLVSGENIKTLNNTSLLGSGDIPLKTINGASIIGDEDIVVSAKVYAHIVKFSNDYSIVIYLTNDTPFTETTLAQWLYNKGFRSSGVYFPTSPYAKVSGSNLLLYYGISSSAGTSISGRVMSIGSPYSAVPDFDSLTFTSDNVVEM